MIGALWAATALGSGLAVGPTHIAAWRRHTVRVYARGQLAEPVSRASYSGELLAVVPWQGGFAVIEAQDLAMPCRAVHHQTPDGERVSIDACGRALAAHNGRDALWVFAADGRIRAYERPGEPPHTWVVPGLEDVFATASTSAAVLAAGEQHLWALTPGDPVRVARGRAALPIKRVVPVGSDKVLTVGWRGTERVLERWSLFAEDAPLPLPLGARKRDGVFYASVPLDGGGTWLLSAGAPQLRPGLEGVVVGAGLPQPPVGAAIGHGPADEVIRDPSGNWVPAAGTGDTALVLLGSGDFLELDLPALQPATPASAGPLGQLLWRHDLPLGEAQERYRLGAALPVPLEVRLPQEDAAPVVAPVYRMPAVVHDFSRSMHEEFYSKRYEYAFRHPGERVPRFLGASGVAGGWLCLLLTAILTSLPAWMYLTVRGRASVMRDEPNPLLSFLARWNRVVTEDRNPFRDDSPDDATRTPFAHHPFVGEVRRALARNHVVVEAPMFSGKSVLLRHLVHRIHGEGIDGEPARAVLIELYGVPEAAFWTRVGRTVAAAFPDIGAAAEVQELETLDRASVEYLLQEIVDGDSPRLVLVLDDLDALAAYRTEGQRFRGLLQMVPELTVLGTAVALRRFQQGAVDESPWFNIFQVRHLRPMRPVEIDEYLARHLRDGFSYDRSVPEWLFAASRGRPLIVWLLCTVAVEDLVTDFVIQRRLRLTAADIASTVAHLRELALEGAPLDAQTVGPLLGAARQERDRLADLLEPRTP